MAGTEVTGLFQQVASAAAHPFLQFKLQPGRWKGTGKNKTFVPNPRYPDGISISIPAWLIVVLGFTTVVLLASGTEKLFSGLVLSKEERAAKQEALEKLGPAQRLFVGLFD